MSTLPNMTFVAYSDDTYNDPIPGRQYMVMLNPEKMQFDRSIKYNDETPVGGAPSIKYSQTNTGNLSFELVIDCTGVVDSSRVNLPAELASLSKVIYDYNGDIHSPNYVKIKWGGNPPFNCVLTKLNTSYTFFKPDGTPLRARVALAFSYFIDPVTLANEEDNKSPDLTHLVTVVEGDNLPQISQRIYRSPQFYIQVAQANELDKFRRLRPGLQLRVPPLLPEGAHNA